MKKYFLSLSVIILLITNNLFSQSIKSDSTLTISVTGFRDNIGQTIVQLFRKEDKVPTKPFRQVKAEIVNKESVISVKDLLYGEYAVIVVHDQNSNGLIDHSWGFPSEPLGFSNNWKLTIFSGMPSFNKLKFIFSSTNNRYLIKMND